MREHDSSAIAGRRPNCPSSLHSNDLADYNWVIAHTSVATYAAGWSVAIAGL